MRLRPNLTKKQSRQHVILQLVKECQLKTQDDLKKALTSHGFEVTQSSLSRDITELGIIKHAGCYAVAHRPRNSGLPQIKEVVSAGPNLLVIKTMAAMAAPVGIIVDENKIHGVIGTISGDDTVFIATRPKTSHNTIIKQVRNIFKGA